MYLSVVREVLLFFFPFFPRRTPTRSEVWVQMFRSYCVGEGVVHVPALSRAPPSCFPRHRGYRIDRPVVGRGCHSPYRFRSHVRFLHFLRRPLFVKCPPWRGHPQVQTDGMCGGKCHLSYLREGGWFPYDPCAADLKIPSWGFGSFSEESTSFMEWKHRDRGPSSVDLTLGVWWVPRPPTRSTD